MVDILQVLTQQPDFQTARKYWNKLKERLGKEGNQSVTNCHRLKLPAARQSIAVQENKVDRGKPPGQDLHSVENSRERVIGMCPGMWI